ncbi:hypothetical protein APHAL10511_007897 [Amanita phalloides]|nr:hypothetical protein APHAL10511_007897 [Amanita phalloides]
MHLVPDNNPRPQKRQRLAPVSNTNKDAPDSERLPPIPYSTLLLALPSILIHPPTHPHHQLSLHLSSEALETCLGLPDIEGDLECRAWTALAEVGLIQGIPEPGTADKAEKAVAKALLIAQKHPSLRLYRPHLSLLSARVAYYHQNNAKHAAQIVRRLLNTLVPSDPPHVAYAAHLALISYSETESPTKVLHSIHTFQALATDNGHGIVALLAQVIRLRVLLREGLWPSVGSSLKEAEDAFHMDLAPSSASPTPKAEQSAAQTALQLHLLIMGVVYYTYAGDMENASSRLTKLHELLDSTALNGLGDSGIVELPLQGERSLYVQMTHPRVLYLLAFLVSSVSKRNPIGRKPKRKVFATEGLTIAERELRKEIALPQWASLHEARDTYSRVQKLMADMLSELVANAISRSECDDAERFLNALVAHTRSTTLFPMFAARITLHHAHLAHSLGQIDRALDCYRVAAYLSRPGIEDNDCIRMPRERTRMASPIKESGRSPRRRSNTSPTKKSPQSIRQLSRGSEGEDGPYPEDTWVHVSARVGEVWLRIGLVRRRRAKSKEDSARPTDEDLNDLVVEGEAIAKECEGLGGTLRAIGEVMKACLSNEVLKSKGHLRVALELASASQDNHLRALIIALISSHYFHTARDHAESMLLTCEHLVVGMGAPSRPSDVDICSGKPPLSTSDNVNRSRKDPHMDADVASKPRSKRKACELGEEENCTPSPRPLKDKRHIDDPSPQACDAVGNAQLRLWIGERSLELSRWAGKEQNVKMQEVNNRKLQEAVHDIEKRAGVC